jgi:olefin beta-lactone synthetase
MSDDNVLSVLHEVALRVPERPALGMESGVISFGALWDRIGRAAAGLRRLGLGAGERAIVMIPMSIDLYVAMLALLEIGAVAVFVDPWIGRRQIAAFAAFAGPRAWIGVPRSHLLRLLDPRLRAIPIAITTGRRLGPLPAPLSLAELEREAGDGSIRPVSPGDPALITFTTGSSGEPKGANRTHGFLLAQRAALAAEFPAREGDVEMTMFPVFALNNLAAGVPSIVPAMDFRRVDRVDAGRVLAQMRRHGVTTCTASPPFFDRLAAALETAKERPRLRRLLTGGAPVSDAQVRVWRRAFPETEILVAYGSTEAEPVAHLTAEERLAATNPGRPLAPGYCAGAPIGRLRARVVRIHAGPIELGVDGWAPWELAAGEIGELVVTGEHVCRDYYRNPGAVRETKIADPDGAVWHRMGDTGSFDALGRFWLAGRVHSTIRRGGALVHPQLVEQAALGDDPRLRRAAAVGLPDAELGERVVLAVETCTAKTAEGIAGEIAARVAAAGLPLDGIALTGEPLPVDPRHNSKIDYAKLRLRLRNEWKPLLCSPPA